MKKMIKALVSILSFAIVLSACGQNNKNITKEDANIKKEATLEMNKDSLYNSVVAGIEERIAETKSNFSDEALGVISETQNLLSKIKEGKTDEAIKKGKDLIGNLEVLLAKDPSLALIPVEVSSKKEELVADIDIVKANIKLVKEAINNGEYRIASDFLKNLRSEMIISSYFIPTATYPEAIKAAIIMLEDGKKEEAKTTLINVLNSIVIQEVVIPLPVLNAEEMIKEAAKIDAKNHENAEKTLNLLRNADYQLKLAEELGYGKKDKTFKELSTAIKVLKKSVERKEDSKTKFDSLKDKVKDFKNKFFEKK